MEEKLKRRRLDDAISADDERDDDTGDDCLPDNVRTQTYHKTLTQNATATQNLRSEKPGEGVGMGFPVPNCFPTKHQFRGGDRKYYSGLINACGECVGFSLSGKRAAYGRIVIGSHYSPYELVFTLLFNGDFRVNIMFLGTYDNTSFAPFDPEAKRKVVRQTFQKLRAMNDMMTAKEIRDMKTLAAAFLFNTDTQMDSDPIAEMQIGTKDADYHEDGYHTLLEVVTVTESHARLHYRAVEKRKTAGGIDSVKSPAVAAMAMLAIEFAVQRWPTLGWSQLLPKSLRADFLDGPLTHRFTALVAYEDAMSGESLLASGGEDQDEDEAADDSARHGGGGGGGSAAKAAGKRPFSDVKSATAAASH